jgi:hypothetical protein
MSQACRESSSSLDFIYNSLWEKQNLFILAHKKAHKTLNLG